MSYSRTLRACLLVAALATALSISFLLANAHDVTHASSLSSLSLSGSKPTTDESSPDASKPGVDGCWSLYGVAVPPSSTLQDVVTLSPSDAWAVGSQSVDGIQSNLILHWTGVGWHVVPSPNPDYEVNILTSILALSPNDIWVAGRSGGYTYPAVEIIHWDGTQWTQSSIPETHGLHTDLSAVSADDVWAVTDDGALHWDGIQWRVVSVPELHYGIRSAIAPVSSTDIWMAGTSTNGPPIFFHSNGSLWTPVNTPAVGSVQGVNRMAVLATDDIWAVGYYASSPSMLTNTLIEHWNGTEWSVVPSPNLTGNNVLNDVKFLSPTDGWAVGSGSANLAILLHWDGSAWNSVALPGPQPQYGELKGIYPLSDTEMWVVGNDLYDSRVVALRYTEPCVAPTNTPTSTSTPGTPTITPTPTSVVLPTNWISTTPPNVGAGNVTLRDVSVVSANDVWAVGSYLNSPTTSIALHWDGSAWSNVSLPVFTYTLYSVSAYAHNDVWMLAQGNLTLHWNGSQWTASAIPAAWTVFGLVAVAPNKAVAFSLQLVEPEHYDWVYSIFTWNGTAWDYQLGPGCGLFGGGNLCNLNNSAMHAFAPNDVWVGGSDDTYRNRGVLLHWDGNAWSKVQDPEVAAGEVLALTGTSSSDLWLSTASEFLHWDGSSWRHYPHTMAISNMAAVSPSDVWAVGSDIILHWNGVAWGRVQNAPGQTSLASIDSVTCGDVWAVGGSSNPSYHNMLLAHYSGPCLPSYPTAAPTNTPEPIRCAHDRFTDVCPGDYFYEHVLDLNDLGIISGYTSSPPCDSVVNVPCFKPYNWTTRGQIAKVVSLAAGFDEDVTGQSFEDVTPGNTFYAYIERMASRGIISGYPCGGAGEPCGPGNLPYFRPGNQVSRGQLAKMAAVAFGFIEPVSGIVFQDVPPGYTFYDYIERLAARAIISGYPCGGDGEPCVPPDNLPYYRPGNIISRGQIAKIVDLARTQPTATPTPAVSPTDTPTGTATVIIGPTDTPTDTPVVSQTDTPTPDATSSPETTGTPSATDTPQPTLTSTPTPTP